VTSPFAIDLAKEVSLDIGLAPGQNAWFRSPTFGRSGWEGQEVTR
jgi:hypothetical protein